MRIAFVMAIVLLLAVASRSVERSDDLGLPSLHKIERTTLSPSYSCRSAEDSHRGYEESALFLSKYSEHRNAPDLLFNGACHAPDYFQGATAGDDMSLVADLGHIPLETVSAHLAFNTANRASFELESKFAWKAKVENGHTYALLINKSDQRGLVIFTVVRYVPNRAVELEYAVKEYQVLNRKAESQGFNWSAQNQPGSNPAPQPEPNDDCDTQPE